MEDWKSGTIRDYGRVVTGHTPPTAQKEYWGDGYKFITPTDIGFMNYFVESTNSQVTELAKDKFGKKFLPPFSVSYTCIGNTIGKACLNREEVITNQQINSIIPSDNHDYRFIYYQLNCLENTIRGAATGAATPIINKTKFESIKVKYPVLPIQKKIGGILSAYDNLIENNLKRIKLLEELAQITYEEWFVRLRFPGHENTSINPETNLPEGWEERNFGSFLEYEIGGGWGNDGQDVEFSDPAYVIRGTDIDGLAFGEKDKVPFRYHKVSNLESRNLKNGDIIFEVSGGSQNEGVAKTIRITDELLSFFDGKVMCASFCKLVRPTSLEDSLFIFHFLRFLRKSKGTEVFEIRSASNIVNYNWQAFMKYQMVKAPPQSLINSFYDYAINIYKQISDVSRQNQLLREARDILLPRFMTGMIDVEEYDPSKLLQEAA